MTGAVTADSTGRGRTTITSRAVSRVVSAVTADQLGVDASDVSVDLSDDRGDLVVTAGTPIHVSPLGTGSGQDGTVLDRLARAREEIQDRTRRLTGSSISRVDLHITGARLKERRRVS